MRPALLAANIADRYLIKLIAPGGIFRQLSL